jgi:hypothetical protein
VPQVVGDGAQQPGERHRAAQLVVGVLAQAVGDAHVEAELEEHVGRPMEHRAHRRGGRHGGPADPEVDQPPVGQRRAQRHVVA